MCITFFGGFTYKIDDCSITITSDVRNVKHPTDFTRRSRSRRMRSRCQGATHRGRRRARGRLTAPVPSVQHVMLVPRPRYRCAPEPIQLLERKAHMSMMRDQGKLRGRVVPSVTVPVVAVDQLLGRRGFVPEALLIDAEGYGRQMLEGANATLRSQQVGYSCMMRALRRHGF
jgi:hypothetical protein